MPAPVNFGRGHRFAAYPRCSADVAQERRLAGGLIMTWLVRSGQRWKIGFGSTCTWVGLALLCSFFAFRWHVAFLASLALLIAGFVLPTWIRCRVCGLQLLTSGAALRLPQAERDMWLSELRECPVCGDDGSATGDVRIIWSRGGRTGEPPYWSWKRVVAALLLAVLFVVGGVAVAELRIRTWARGQQAPSEPTPQRPAGR